MKVGDIISFYASPESMALLCPNVGNVRFCGEMVSVKPMGYFGTVPEYVVHVRGKTGKEVSIGFVQLYGQIHDGWKSATEACAQANKTRKTK